MKLASERDYGQVVELMGQERGKWWRFWHSGSELRRARKFLETFEPKAEHKHEEIKAAETGTSVSALK